MLLMFVGVFTLFFFVAALALDYGLWLSERRGVARAADMAVLAAVRDLPATPNQTAPYTSESQCGALASCRAAFDWADRNGYGETTGATVTVEYWCGNSVTTNPPPGLCVNEASGTPFGISPCPTDSSETGCDMLNVTVTKPAKGLFGKARFGWDPGFDIGFKSWASVTVQQVPLDMVLTIDASGSMACGSGPCPIVEARNAALNFKDILLAGSMAQVAYAPYRDCYSPPNTHPACIPTLNIAPGDCPSTDESWVVCLTNDEALLEAKINATQVGAGTNLCLGLHESWDLVTGPGASGDPEAKQFVVLLTDGANGVPSGAALPNECDPGNGGGGGDDCGAPPSNVISDLDELTYEIAQDMNNAGIEIFVVGLNVCGTNDPDEVFSPAQCLAQVGDPDARSVGNRRLLKCVADSTPGSNDHYFEASASELSTIFQTIALKISEGGLEGGFQ